MGTTADSPSRPDGGSPDRGRRPARDWLKEQGEAILAEQIEIARTPAPPFGEGGRASLIASRLQAFGMAAESDDVGNLLAVYPPSGDGAGRTSVIVAAHMDTVFGPDTPIRIRQSGRRWVGAGVADNARGLAVSLGVLRALVQGGVQPERPLVFAFTVGEEGSGDLRGVKHLMRPGTPLREAAAFIAVDGSGLRRIIHRGLGVRRYRIAVRGPGGHSWNHWGRPNPAHVIGDLIHHLARVRIPSRPRTTLTVARLGGGTSINSIPTECWAEVDLRSESPIALEEGEAAVRESIRRSVAAEARRARDGLEVSIAIIGERPAGELSLDHPLVQSATEATRDLGEDPEPAISSTDANVPLALGMPAIALGGGGASGDTHTENEWFENTDGAAGALRILSVLAATAGF